MGIPGMSNMFSLSCSQTRSLTSLGFSEFGQGGSDLTSAVSFPNKVEPLTQLNNTIYFAASLQNLSLRHLLDRCRTQCTRWVLEMLEKNGDVSTVPEMFGM